MVGQIVMKIITKSSTRVVGPGDLELERVTTFSCCIPSNSMSTPESLDTENLTSVTRICTWAIDFSSE
jgi:hypothetical protein